MAKYLPVPIAGAHTGQGEERHYYNPLFYSWELGNENSRVQEEPRAELRTQIVVLVWHFDCKVSFPFPLVTDECQKIQHPAVDVLLI